MHDVTDTIVAQHGLTSEEFEQIKKILGRLPNLLELGIFSVMWSEHCSYKSSKIYLKKLPTASQFVLQGPGENAGIVAIDKDYAIAFKIESHNHPSFIEPYQGAATGVGGIIRDIFTMGARPIASLNSLRFGEIEDPKTAHLLNGVISGIGGYGNAFGCPTVGGEVYFHKSYNGNILVNAFNLGLVKKDKIFKGKAEGVGNKVFYVGSKTGRDGIHGASLLASHEFDETTESKRPTVQVGDPFTEKLLLEACLDAMDKGVVLGIQDMGAAGLTCSSVEMASRAGNGVELNLETVPVREEGMTPYELMLSESQERMLLVAKPGMEGELKNIFKKWDLDAVEVGKVTDDKNLVLKFNGEKVGEIPIFPLADEAPIYERPFSKPLYIDRIANIPDVKFPKDFNKTVIALLGSPNLCSKKWVYRQYDQQVGINSVQLPGGDAAVVRIKEVSPKGVAISTDCNSRYVYLSPKIGTMIAVAEAARNVSCVGATPIALTNCLNFGSPENPEIMWQFKESTEGLREVSLKFEIPVISGNVSFYNETNGEAIYPTPVIGMVGVLDDVSKAVRSYFTDKKEDIILIGEDINSLKNDYDGLAGSEYLNVIHNLEVGVPYIDLELEMGVQSIVRKLIHQGLIRSCHDCSDGGLAIALAEMAINSPARIGCEIKINSSNRFDTVLFGERGSRIVVSVKSENREQVLSLLDESNIPYSQVGKTSGDHLKINNLINIKLSDAERAWSSPLEERYASGF